MNPLHLFSIKMTCKYCPWCDLIIVNKFELEKVLNMLMVEQFKKENAIKSESDYFVIGIIDFRDWADSRKTPAPLTDILEKTYPFKNKLDFVPASYLPRSRGPRNKR